MVLNLSTELQKALDAEGNQPLRLIDPRTAEVYVMVKLANFQRLHSLLDSGPLTREEQLYFLGQAGKRAGWDDPEMDVCNDLDPRKKS